VLAVRSDLSDPALLGRILARVAVHLRKRAGVDSSFAAFSVQDFRNSLGTVLQQEGLKNSDLERLLNFFSSTRLLNLPLEFHGMARREGFVHQLFFEILAAQGIALYAVNDEWQTPIISDDPASAPSALVAEGIHNPTWAEVIKFVPSQLESTKRERFFGILFEDKDDLVRGRISLALQALAELPQPGNTLNALSEAIADKSLAIITEHWRRGTTQLIARLVSAASNIASLSSDAINDLIAKLKSPKLENREVALEWLVRIGASPASIAQNLAGAEGLRHHNGYIRRLAGAALCRLGEVGFSELAFALDSTEWPIRMSACEAIGEYSRAGTSIVPSKVVSRVIDLSHEQFVPLRTAACEALGLCGKARAKDAGVVERLVVLLSSKESTTVRAHAAQALGRLPSLTSESRPALQGLLKCLVAKEELLQAAAVEALANLVPNLGALRAFLFKKIVEALSLSPSASAIRGACDLLSVINVPDSNESLEEPLRDLLKHKDRSTNIRAATALGGMRQWDSRSECYELILKGLTDDSEVRRLALKAFRTLSSYIIEDENRVEQVRSQLDKSLARASKPQTSATDDDWLAAIATCEALGIICQHADKLSRIQLISIQTLLVKCIRSGRPEMLRAAALEAIANIGLDTVEDRAINDVLICLGRNWDWYLRVSACKALAGRLTVPPLEARRAAHSVLECMDSPKWIVRAHACEAVAKLSPYYDNEEHLRALVASIGDSQEPVRRKACTALLRVTKASPYRVEITPEFGGKRLRVKIGGTIKNIPVPTGVPGYLQSSLDLLTLL
jgi:HEAT repeats